MANDIRFDTQRGNELGHQIEALAASLKGFKWKITRENLGACEVQHRVHTAISFALSKISEEIFDATHPDLELLMGKIMVDGKVIETLTNPAQKDPRLFTLLEIKIPGLNQNSIHRDQKIEKYGQLLEKFAGSDHQVSHDQIVRAQMQLMRASLTQGSSKPALPDSVECRSPIASLQEAISCLAADDFLKALDGILELDGLTLNTCAGEQQLITNRIFSHLRSIHRVDPNEVQYGSKAFLSPGMSTSIEKLRAAQRTQVEVSLYALKECLKGDQTIDSPVPGKSTLIGIFEVLENLKLDPKDLPKDQKNIAHALFGKLYTIYLAAWEKNKSMIHPHDPIFKSDFGRNAFVGGSKGRIPNAYKIQAINEISQSLQGVWC